MLATFADADAREVQDGIGLYRCPTSHRHFIHFPPSTFLWVEPHCLDHPGVCRRDEDRFTLCCCDPTRIESGEIRFVPSGTRQPRLVLVHLSRRLITFDNATFSEPEPEDYGIAIGPNLCVSRSWESGHHEVTVGENGRRVVDREYWALATMMPGDRIKATIQLTRGPTHSTFARADGEVVVCGTDGTVTMKKLLARAY